MRMYYTELANNCYMYWKIKAEIQYLVFYTWGLAVGLPGPSDPLAGGWREGFGSENDAFRRGENATYRKQERKKQKLNVMHWVSDKILR